MKNEQLLEINFSGTLFIRDLFGPFSVCHSFSPITSVAEGKHKNSVRVIINKLFLIKLEYFLTLPSLRSRLMTLRFSKLHEGTP